MDTVDTLIKNSHVYGFFHPCLQPDQLHLLTRHPASLCADTIRVFKDEPRARVTLIKWHGREYILKYYNVKSSFFKLRRFIFPSFARQKWQIVQEMKKRHIATPELLASLDVGKRLHYKGTLCLYEYVKPDRDILRLEKDFAEPARRKIIIDAVVTFVSRMHRSGIYHSDAKISNFLWLERQKGVSLQIIDLDGVCFVNNLSDRQRLSELTTLVTSLAWWDNDPILISRCLQVYMKDDSSWCRNAEAICQKLQNKVGRKLAKRKKTWKP